MNSPTLSTLSLVFDYVLRASLLGAAAIALVLLIRWMLGRRLAPGARSWLWFPVAVLCLSPQLPGLVGWAFTAEALPTPVRKAVAVEDYPAVVVQGEPEPLLEAPDPVIPAAPVARFSVREKMALAWAASALTILLFWLAAYAGLWRRLRHQQEPVSEGLAAEFRVCASLSGLKRLPRLMVSAAVESPAVAGLWRPVVLMPPRLAESLGEEALRHVLLHELAHIKRRDLWLHWASALVVAVHWFNPLVWIASRKFRGDRESACDAAVIGLGENRAHAYGQTLLTLETRVTQTVALRLMAGILGGADLVRQRIVDITRLGKTSRRAAWSAFSMVLGGAAVIALAAAEPAAPKVIPPSTKEATPSSSSEELYTRTYRVSPDFHTWRQIPTLESWRITDGNASRRNAIEVLKELGIPFPEGASATFIPSTSQLIVRNTTTNLNLIRGIVDAKLNTPVRQVYIRSHLVVFKEGISLPVLPGASAGTLEKPASLKTPAKAGEGSLSTQQHPGAPPETSMHVAGAFTDAQFQVLLKSLMGKGTPSANTSGNGASFDLTDLAPQVEAVIGLPPITTRSERRGTLEVARDFIYPTEYDRKEPAEQGESALYVPKKFEMRPIGIRLEIDPVVSPFGNTLELDLGPELQGFMGWADAPAVGGGTVKTPICNTSTVHTVVTMQDGHTIAFGGYAYVAAFLMNSALKGEEALISKKHPVMIFVTAMMVDPSGQPLKSEVPAVEKNGASEKASSVRPTGAAVVVLGTPSVSRAVIDVGPGVVYTGQPDEAAVAKFVHEQIELLQSPEIRKRAADRTETYHPYVAPVPIKLSASRMLKTTQVEVTATGTSADYTRFFLKRLLEVLIAQRKEVMEESTLGVASKAVLAVVEKTQEVELLTEEQKNATDRKAPQGRLDKIKADLGRTQEELRVAREKLVQMDVATIHRETKFFELQILEHPTSAEVK
ncbi:beta-lactamase regulating signal transducer with metallopeptidase domain [Roseimicrobium gellanilyticum]|uniref:Beta-lactamase regulating signal transducer with metallopeptidase domain n=1 Tax=Roseimicrobium gellanilyticum TaxID=748857 RepID=A0A366HA19_9BACT|nr:M56 family metallopeptidase [Roseimicrobium gellanilyticum]RBP39141.1 beta-lactamase regulating signal transducer with metallopeptidase domain [Roseimicrobium gellanilyticum]